MEIFLPASLALSPGAIRAIRQGGVHVEPAFLPPELCDSLCADAKGLFSAGLFSADGLTNTAVPKGAQGFSTLADRQTFRADGWDSDVGDRAARRQFARRMSSLREELAVGLSRPSLGADGERKHEMIYNWYETGARLGRHLDEHHEETKGARGWLVPTRRSVTWLVYLNDGWTEADGGALRTFPRPSPSLGAVGADDGNLQARHHRCARPPPSPPLSRQ